jgi:hypothetical protein
MPTPVWRKKVSGPKIFRSVYVKPSGKNDRILKNLVALKVDSVEYYRAK